MSQYYRNHPDEPIRHDWVSGSGAKRISDSPRTRSVRSTDGVAVSTPKGNGDEPDKTSNPQRKQP